MATVMEDMDIGTVMEDMDIGTVIDIVTSYYPNEVERWFPNHSDGGTGNEIFCYARELGEE